MYSIAQFIKEQIFLLRGLATWRKISSGDNLFAHPSKNLWLHSTFFTL